MDNTYTMMTPEEAIKSDKFSHARQGNGLWRDIVWIYHHANTPSGYFLAASGKSEIVDPLLRKYRNTSPLSPTER